MHARCLNGNTIIGLSPQLPSLTATCQSAIFDLQNNSKYAAATTTFYSRVAPLITLGLKRIYPNLYGIDRLLPSPEPNLSCRFLSLILIPATDGSASRDLGRLGALLLAKSSRRNRLFGFTRSPSLMASIAMKKGMRTLSPYGAYNT